MRLWVSPREVKNRFVALAPQRAFDLVGTHAHTVVTNVILELARLFWNEHANDVLHGVVVTLKHGIHSGIQNVIAESFCQLNHTLGGGIAGSNQRVQVESVPLWCSDVVQNQLQEVFLKNTFLVQLSGRNTDAFLEDGCRLNWNRARHHTAVV